MFSFAWQYRFEDARVSLSKHLCHKMIATPPVAFLAVASAIREHEVVAQVHRIPSPRDEVIDVGCLWRNRCVTVEAPAPLDIEQDGAYDSQGRSLATEENSFRSAVFTEQIQVLLTY